MPGIFRVNIASIATWNWRYVLQIQVVGNPQRRPQRLKIWSRAWKNLNCFVFSIIMAIISGVQWDNRPVPLLLVGQPQLVQHEADDQREEERSPQVQWPPLLWHLRPPQVWAIPPFLPVRGKNCAQKYCDAKYIERPLGEIGQGYLILAQMLIERLHRVYAVKILLQVMWTICHNLRGESSQMLFLTCHFNKQPIYLSIATTQNDYFWAFCTWINLSMYKYISLFWKFNFAALEFPLTRSASRPTRFHLGRSQQRRLEVIL